MSGSKQAEVQELKCLLDKGNFLKILASMGKIAQRGEESD